MKRTQLMLVGALAVQLVLILLVRSPFASNAAQSASMPLLPMLEAISPTRLEIAGDEEVRTTLIRQGDDWKIEQLGNFPADGEKVRSLLEKLEGLEVRRPVVSSTRYHEAFEVSDDENRGRVRIFSESDDAPRVDLIVGSSANYQTTNVRIGGQNEVYEIQGLAAYDVRPESASWIRKTLVEADQAAVDRVTVTNKNGSFELERRDGTWVVAAPAELAGTELDQGKVDSLVQRATGLRLADGIGPVDAPVHGFTEPAATLELGWSSGGAEGAAAITEHVTLEIGGKPADEETKRFVTRSGFDFTGTVWESSVLSLIEDGLDALQPDADEG